MSKHQPNQDFYKIGGSAQSDGSDRGDRGKVLEQDKQRFAQSEQNAKHPAVKRTAKKK